ncbi:aminotransferase [Gymnopilus junonius]|uniref:Aminotransferase n=1 Tax=Gymnopilus junonius TaxID=109634 RepID=A0A9P5TSW6_GYMJU|nr:aminotransferase [Gymnopilus junonius]
MATEGENAFQLLSSTRFDPYLTSLHWNDDEDGPCSFFLLPLHFQRLASGAETHSWTHAKSLLDYRALKLACINAVSEQDYCSSSAPAVYRIRIAVSVQGRIAVTATSLPASFASDPTLLPIPDSLAMHESHHDPVLRIYIDKEVTAPTIFTRTKTTFRNMYDSAKTRNESQWRSGPEGVAWDILLYNQGNQIMEATIFNVAFLRSSKWITPCSSTGCLPGVLRRWLLDNGRIIEDTKGQLSKDTLKNGEWVLLFNGVQGVRLGKIYI